MKGEKEVKKVIAIVLAVVLVLILGVSVAASPGDTGSSTAANKMVAVGSTVEWMEPDGDAVEVSTDSGADLDEGIDDSLTTTMFAVTDSSVFALGDTIKIDDEYMYVKSIDVPVDSGTDLAAAVAVDDTTILVKDGTVFTVGDIIKIDDEVLEVASITLNGDDTIGLSSPATESHRKGSMIFIVTLDTIMVDRDIGGDDLGIHTTGADIYIVTWEAETILLTVEGKYSNPTDLMIQFTAESALFTKISSGGKEQTGDVAFAQVEVWVEIDGNEVLVTAGDPDGSVVFNNREFGIKTLNLPDRSLIELYLQTRSANAFNWVQLNAGELDDGDGMLTIEVKGKVTTNKPNTEAMAGIGKRVLIVEPTKMASGTPGM